MITMCSKLNNQLVLAHPEFKDYGIDKSFGYYVLSSANQAYLINKADFANSNSGFSLNFVDPSGCPAGTDDSIIAHSNNYSSEKPIVKGKLLQYDSIDPDIHSMSLTHLITNYFFVARENPSHSKGLYRVTSTGKQLSEPELISDKIDQINISYLLDYANTFNKSGTNLGQRYTICTTKEMEGGRLECKDQWDKIVAVTINLSASDNSATMAGDNHDQKIRETIGWKS